MQLRTPNSASLDVDGPLSAEDGIFGLPFGIHPVDFGLHPVLAHVRLSFALLPALVKEV